MHYFISDIHLSDDAPEITAQLLAFLQYEAPKAKYLYILGDLFETWVGDDDPTALGQPLIEALQTLKSAGTACYFMHGNRDFMVGDAFCEQAGLALLPDPTVIDLYGQNVLLAHGDAYCTDDTEYQAFRQLSRDPQWQQGMLAKPLAERLAIAQAARAQSAEHQMQANEAIMDVNHNAIVNAFAKADLTTMIHGHTHRPAIHQWQTDAGELTRIVLGDWYEQGSVLKWHKKGFELSTLARA